MNIDNINIGSDLSKAPDVMHLACPCGNEWDFSKKELEDCKSREDALKIHQCSKCNEHTFVNEVFDRDLVIASNKFLSMTLKDDGLKEITPRELVDMVPKEKRVEFLMLITKIGEQLGVLRPEVVKMAEMTARLENLPAPIRGLVKALLSGEAHVIVAGGDENGEGEGMSSKAQVADLLSRVSKGTLH